MLPTSLEVAQSLRGAWRLKDHGVEALGDFEFTPSGLAKSFAAILLTVPALVAVLAANRLQAGHANSAGLFSMPDMALQTLLLPVVTFLLVPALVLALFWNTARTANGTRFVVTWNWTEIIVTMLLAFPAALLAAGVVKPALGSAVFVAFALIAAHLRYAAARVALGLGVLNSSCVVALAFIAEIGLMWALAVGRIQ
jgi:hypothetical protein